MQYAFPCNIEGNAEDGDGFVATFPDLQGAITGGFTFKETVILAEDCLVVTLGAYIDCQKELPIPSPWKEGQELFTVQPLIAAQLDLYTALRKKGISMDDLAHRLKIPGSEVQKLLVLDYNTSINQVFRALEALDSEAALGEAVA